MSSNMETIQILQRLSSLRIVETPPTHKELGKRECYSLDGKGAAQVPATPSTSVTFLTELKKRRKVKRNRVYAYETDEHFVKARKSLNF